MKVQRLVPKGKKIKASQADKLKKYARLRHLVPNHITLRLDGVMCAITGEIHLDMLHIDQSIPNYDYRECKYKGKPNYSMKMAIIEEWGEEAATLIKELL